MGVIRSMRDYISWLYFQYTLVTAVYMLEPIERYIFNLVILLTIVTAAYTTYVYLPSHCTMVLDYLGFMDPATETS